MMKIKKLPQTKGSLKKVPETPGVYLFWNEKNEALYIGKANNLRRRLGSYFSEDLAPKTMRMVQKARSFSFIEVVSELESLLLEARLIRLNRPKYNIELKDDKHPLYIIITKKDYPQVLTVRKDKTKEKSRAIYGPFPSSTNLRQTLKMLRKIFPFAEHGVQKRPCLYSQIGLCSPCPSEIENVKDKTLKTKLKKEYKRNITYLNMVLSGKMKIVRDGLRKEMTALAKENKFEEAAVLRDKIERLDYVTQPVNPIERFIENPNHIEDIRYKELVSLKDLLKKEVSLPKSLRRIECFDIAHLSGVSPTASMVVFINGEAEKSNYRHFKIRQKKGKSDTDSLSEVARRRVKYLATWGVPDLIIVDGGKGQVSSFKKVFEKHRVPVIGLAKREEILIIPKNGGFNEIRAKGPTLNLVQRLRNEAHRFARRYHHNLLQKELLKAN